MRYDQLAYSLLRGNVHFHNVDKELSYIKSLLDSEKKNIRTAIDIGCGDGRITKKIKTMLDIPLFYGMDINGQLLKKAQAKGIKTIRCNANKITLKTKYDLVLSYGSLHHMENTKHYFRNLIKVCKRYLLMVDCTVRNNLLHRLTNAKFCRFDASSHPIRTLDEIKQTLSEVGFNLLHEKTHHNASIWFDRSIILARV